MPYLYHALVYKDLGESELAEISSWRAVSKCRRYEYADDLKIVKRFRVMHQRQDEFMTRFQITLSFYDSNNSGHLLSRITFNVAQINEAGTLAITIIVREGLIVLGLLSYLLYLNWQLTVCQSAGAKPSFRLHQPNRKRLVAPDHDETCSPG